MGGDSAVAAPLGPVCAAVIRSFILLPSMAFRCGEKRNLEGKTTYLSTCSWIWAEDLLAALRAASLPAGGCGCTPPAPGAPTQHSVLQHSSQCSVISTAGAALGSSYQAPALRWHRLEVQP